MAIRNKLLFIILLISLGASANASRLCSKQNLGWHFYCDPKENKDNLFAPENRELQIQQAKQELAIIKQRLEDLKIAAVINPTPGNIREYLAFQKEQLERASNFSSVWQQVVWQTPELDNLVKNPISTIGNELKAEMKRENIKAAINNLRVRYGLFFFYSSQCGYCHKASPIIKAFADYYKIEVMPVSMDGGILPEWPESAVNKGEADRLGISGKPVPALVLFDLKSKETVPVGFGLLSLDQIEERILRLTSKTAESQEGNRE